MRERHFRQFRPVPLSYLLIFGLAVQGCFSVRFVSPYDEQTDKAVTDLYRSIAVYMADLQANPQVAEADSIARAEEYEGIRVDIGVLKLRASAKDKNEQQIQQVGLLENSWETVGKLQKANAPGQAFQSAWSGLETTLTAILKLEEAKKQT